MRPVTATSGPTGVTRSAKHDAGYEIQTVDRIGAVDAAEWDATVRALDLPVFYSRAFLSAYEAHPLTNIDAFTYLLLRRRGALVAVLPAFLQARPDPLGHLATAYPEADGQPALLSHVWHCYDTTLGETPDLVEAAMTALRERARRLGAPWCGLVNVHRDGPTARALAAAGLPTRHLVHRFAADLAGLADVEEFLLRSARTAARRNLWRYRRRAAEHGVTTGVVRVEDADPAEVAALCCHSASRHGSDSYYPAGRFERFIAALGSTARVVEIRQRGRLVSASVCLLDDTRLHCWAGGAVYDVDGNFSPYYLMIDSSIALALRLGRTMFEGGRGNPEFKQRHGLAARPLVGCLVRA